MTTRKILTDRGIQALKPAEPGTRYTVYDTIVPPFGIRVTDKGQKSFVVYRRMSGQSRPTRLSLGTYPLVSLDKARESAKAAIAELNSGVHPRAREQENLHAEVRLHAGTFSVVAEEFIKRHVSKLRTRKAVASAIRREMIPRWGGKPIAAITRRHVVEMLEEIMDGRVRDKRKGQRSGGRYAAHHVFAYTSKLFNWAVARDLYDLEFSPCDRIKLREVIGSPEPRQRVLNDEELGLVWRAAEEIGYPFGTLAQLLLVTGQRLNEVARASWDELDPRERMKGDAAHEVPLSSLALEILNDLPRFASTYVLTTTEGERPINGFSKGKERLGRAIALLREGEAGRTPRPPMAHWRFHDLRRTLRTRLSGLPVQDMVRELVIGHRRPGLHRVYDLHAYRDEKREALELWAQELRKVVRAPMRPARSPREGQDLRPLPSN
jgi:integrase